MKPDVAGETSGSSAGVAREPLLAALLLRLLIPAAALLFGGAGSSEDGAWSRFITPDTSSYLTPARHLLESSAFTNLSGPEIFRTPGYPFVLTLGLIAGHPIVVTLLLQALAGTFTVWCVMRTASLLFPDARDARAVMACGWLAACEPLALVCGALVIADTVLTTAISVVVLLVMMHLRQPSTRTAVALGVMLAGAAYIKPIAYYLSVVLIPWLAFEHRGRATRHLLTIVATVALLCGVWHVRNGIQTGFWGFSTLTARAVYVAAGGGVTAAREGRAFGDVRQERLQQAAIRTSSESLHVGDMYRRGLGDVLGSPRIALAVHVKGMLLTLFDPASLDYLRLFGAYPAASPVTRYGGQGLAATVAAIARAYPAVVWCSLLLEAILLAYLALAARGAWRALRSGISVRVRVRVREARVLLLIAACFLVLSGGIFGTARFRLPIMPVMILLGGYALSTRPVGYTEPA